MFAKTIIDSDAFIDMPVTARLLYYDLAMRADDDGFVNAPKKIMRMVGASQDDLSILAIKKFIIPFDNGVVVIKHWRIHNYIRGDTYKETQYKEQKELLELDENKAYRQRPVDEPSTDSPRLVDEPSTQDRIGKDRIGKVRLGQDRLGDNMGAPAELPTTPDEPKPKSKRFVKPTVDEIRQFCADNGYTVDAEYFYDYYEGNGWKVGKNPMKDWRATVRNWERNNRNNPKPTNSKSDSKHDLFQRLYEEAAENDRKRNG